MWQQEEVYVIEKRFYYISWEEGAHLTMHSHTERIQLDSFCLGQKQKEGESLGYSFC